MFKILISLLYNRKLFKPNLHVSSVVELESNPSIKESMKKVRVILFDKDDTLVPLHEFEVKDKNVIETLVSLRNGGK